MKRVLFTFVLAGLAVGTVNAIPASALETPPPNSTSFTLVSATRYGSRIAVSRPVSLSLTPDYRIIAGDGCLEFSGTWSNAPTLTLSPTLTSWCANLDSLSKAIGQTLTGKFSLRYDGSGLVLRVPGASLHFRQGQSCLPNYPDFCIPPGGRDLDCDDVKGRDFTVTGGDPHGFDGDNDGIGCESTDWPSGSGTNSFAGQSYAPVQAVTTAQASASCLPNYPDICIPPNSPDLDCPDVYRLTGKTNFAVRGGDPHRLDADGDGIGCETLGGSSSASATTYTVQQAPAAQQTVVASPPATSGCVQDPNYTSSVCFPYVAGDAYDCPDIRHQVFVVPGGNDHNKLDGDGNGRGCESWPR